MTGTGPIPAADAHGVTIDPATTKSVLNSSEQHPHRECDLIGTKNDAVPCMAQMKLERPTIGKRIAGGGLMGPAASKLAPYRKGISQWNEVLDRIAAHENSPSAAKSETRLRSPFH